MEMVKKTVEDEPSSNKEYFPAVIYDRDFCFSQSLPFSVKQEKLQRTECDENFDTRQIFKPSTWMYVVEIFTFQDF